MKGSSMYAKAAEMAAAQYGLKTATDPMWVVWTSDLDSANSWRIGQAFLDILYAALLGLPLLVVVEHAMKRKMEDKPKNHKHVMTGTHAAKLAGERQSNENIPLFKAATVGHHP
jgi:hypothetical protein